jgi:hypothetical protein
VRLRLAPDTFSGGPFGHDLPARLPCARPHVDHPIRIGDDAHFVLDHDDGVAGLDQAVQLHHQAIDVRRMQAVVGSSRM